MPEREFCLYDSATKRVKAVELGEPGRLRFYSCGPTVYNYAHIGNFRTFITSDLIHRTALALGWEVDFVTNITDVGHLTDDDIADAQGEDKMKRALESKEGESFATIWELSEHYLRAFEVDWAKLNLLEPTSRPRATQHVREQILDIQALIEKRHAYETPTGVYYDVESFAKYGELSGNTNQESLQRGVREVKQDESKRHPADFALWKKDDAHLMQWYSPWGWGFPGWHIECSAMARRYLGDTIDLHGGGEDLLFPHHECEIAQAEGVTDQTFCTHWVHTRFLQVEGERMSKSAGNFYTVRDLVETRGVDPLALRYALMAVPYRKPLNFTMEALKAASGNAARLKAAAAAVEGVAPASSLSGPLAGIYEEALDAMCDDLNTSVAIAKALEGARACASAEPAQAALFLRLIDGLLGVVGVGREPEGCNCEPEEVDGKTVARWIAERAEAKEAKRFEEADAIRERLARAGIELRDSPEGTDWVRAPVLG